jgi:ATP-binding cassette subfamily B protein
MKNNKKNIGLGKYLFKYKFSVVSYVLFIIAASVICFFWALTTAKSIEFLVSESYRESIKYFILTIVLYVSSTFFWFFSSLIYYKAGGKMIADLNCDLANQAFKLSSKTYSDNSTGVFIERIIEDPKRVVSDLSDIVFVLSEIINSFVIVVYIASFNLIIGLIVLVILIGGTTIELIRTKINKKNMEKLYDCSDKITSLTNEIVQSEKDIKTLGLESKLSEISKKNYNEYRKIKLKKECTQECFWRTKDLFVEVGSLLMFILGVLFIEKSFLPVTIFMVVYLNRQDIYGLASNLGRLFDMLVSVKVSSQRMFSLFNDDLFESEKFGNVNLENVIGNIEFKNVSFSYKDYKMEKDKKTKKEIKVLESQTTVFENLSFKIPHNKTVAFVGKSGSGKSTILGLLSKIYNADKGEILIDGNDIQSLDKETLRKTFSLVNQFPYIFDMTIKENLLMANEYATDDEINNVINQAYLGEFLATLKDGINTRLGENGVKLSGGQKQRFAIARALLRKSPIILFDESTSSLDNIAQKEIKKNIDGLKGKSTIIIVAHRLSTIKDADIIFFLDQGNIVKQGTFEELYNGNEKFRNMFLAENI